MPELIDLLIDSVENKYYGKYRGTVVNNKDKKKLGRMIVTVPDLLKNKETGWAFPCFPYGGIKDTGFFAVPEEGSNVWVEFEGGDLSYPIWTGTWLSEPSGTTETPVEAQSTEPNVKVLKTKSGHKIEMHDKEGDEKIVIANKDGSIIKMDSQGTEISSNGGSSLIKLDAEGITLTKSPNSIKITAASVSINGISLEIS
jgi:uncharacterized protein involved in type VI secretion and phage assembly